MRGIVDKDPEAVARWDKSVAKSKMRKTGGKIKGLVDKYLKKGENLALKKLMDNINTAKSIPELEKLGDTASGMKLTSSEIKDLKKSVSKKIGKLKR